MPPEPAQVRAAILDLALRRGAGASFCPSEAARALAADWRPLMAAVRAAAATLAAEGLVEATQRGRRVDPAAARGPIRLRLARPPGGGAAVPVRGNEGRPLSSAAGGWHKARGRM